MLSQSQIAARQPVPRDLPMFSGDVEAWPLFIATYNRTNASCGYTDDENIGRLQHALRGAALEAVGHLLSFPGGLKEAMATLHARFGRPDLIVESMIEKMRRMAPPKVDRLTTVVDFGFAVKRLVGAMTASGLRGYMYDVAFPKELVRKLPPVICIDWARARRHLPEVTLVEFGRWIGDLAEDLCGVIDINPVTSSSDQNRRQPEPQAQPSRGQPQRFKPHRFPSVQSDRRQPVGTGHVHPAYCNTTVLLREDPGEKDPTSSIDAPALLSRCLLCGADCSSLAQCKRFRGTTVTARRAFINERRICRKCLGYHGGRCSAKTPCGVNGCTMQHHELLHLDDRTTASPDQRDPRADSGKGVDLSIAKVHTHSGLKDSTLLKYVPVTLHGPNGRVDTFAFLDDGSTSTFMEDGLLQELGIAGTPHPLCLQWTGDVTREEKDSVRLTVRISGRNESQTLYELTEVHTVKELALPTQSVNMTQLAGCYAHLRGLPVRSYAGALPRVLIGIDNCNITRALKSVDGKFDEPVASKTRLGWVVYGPCSVASAAPGSTWNSFHVCSCNAAPDDILTAAVKRYFDLESIGIDKSVKPLRSKDDERALAILERETTFDGQRYETGLLWRYDSVELPCNKTSALQRYVCLKRKMSKDPILAGAVNSKMKEYKAKGYIRRLSSAETAERHKNDWYLPIFPVTNPNKPGKIRMVFDAAAKVSGVSLNSFLLTGPDMLAGLLTILLKFREFRFAVVGDIREMFHRVGIKKKDQRSEMIFWDGDDPHGDPAVYAVTVMTFGAACSPASAQYVKNRNAERFRKEFPRAVECIQEEHYVDDMLASMETEEEAAELASTVRFIHAQGGFEIRNWASNSQAVINSLQEEPTKGKDIQMGNEPTAEKVLGMWWNTSTDVFTFRLSPKYDEDLLAGERPATKREILRTQMSLYDPMGFLGHFIMYLKVLLQEVWRGGYS
ncbi:uncharacterized protein LOC126564689 [Anopheles maculipalpis]|uniref:uncharacterized protein LOC126564689 n=1 Tax=Anopheles maculipalpis TaxID=1496333 RepID=UPI00215911D9|nr:uncharacterized protein LOC126564689 [Anopheles maculipalpis]